MESCNHLPELQHSTRAKEESKEVHSGDLKTISDDEYEVENIRSKVVISDAGPKDEDDPPIEKA